MELLAKNGTAIGVLKEGVFFNKTYKDLRKCLIENFNVVEIISVPQDQFENTSTKTSIIIFKNSNQKTKEVRFSDLVVEKNEVDEFAELNGEICMTKNKGDISNVSDKLISIASFEDITMNPICSLNAKDYNKKVIVCGKGYELVKLGDIAKLENGKQLDKKNLVDGIYPVYGGGLKPVGYHNEYNRENCTIIAGTGNCGFVQFDKNKFWASQCFTIKSDDDLINKYLFVICKSIENIFMNSSSGSVQKFIRANQFNDMLIPIPKSQSKIKEWVEKISSPYDKMNLNKSRIIELKSFVQVRIKEIRENEDCDLIELEKICKYIKSGKAINNENRKGTLYPYYAANGISGYVDEYIFNGKYIICAQDGSIGATHLVDCKFYASNHVWILKINDGFDPYYIYSILKNNIDYTKITSGSVIPKLTKEKISKLKIHIPKDKKIMQNLEPTFQEIDNLQNEMKEEENKYKKFIKELSEESIPSQETHLDIPDVPSELKPEQSEVIDEPIQDEIVIKKKSSTKTTQKLKSK
jgi:type I restriction enzyme S subunit